MKKITIRGMVVSAIMGVIGFILMLLELSVPIIPSFIKFDVSELPALITSFTFGPLYGILVCLIKNLLKLPVTNSIGIGELSNFILGAVFTGTAGFIYKHKRTRTGALIGSLSGAFLMAVFSVLSNYFIVYPIYAQLFMPAEAILGMYHAILPAADSLIKALLIFNLPFTFVKGFIDTVICFILYKRLSPILRGK